MPIAAHHPAEIPDIVRSTTGRLLPVGGGSKPALTRVHEECEQLDMRRLSGILEYEPEEYTFTALANTPLQEIETELAAHGQYLPFDPVLTGAGATLGGTVAANSAGAGRFRYGGVRDFILGIRFVDGRGRLVRSGGKVVKNAAGFDLAKFMVGSLGRFGILTEVSFKVFPRPRAFLSFAQRYDSLADALAQATRLACSPLELQALDLVPDSDEVLLVARLGGPAASLGARMDRILRFLGEQGNARADFVWEGEEEAAYWRQVNEFAWVPDGMPLFKVPLNPACLPALDERISHTHRRYMAAGNLAWIAGDDVATLEHALNDLGLTGLQLLGRSEQLIIGTGLAYPVLRRVKQVLDPDGKFPEV
ncbi:MAG: FAD-binding protein [Caldilineae bacterium]|nr:MAG: FAD-binding protein [Caldilineae bacterium]